jgi:thiol-disulfide isomerase/thioredoxin
MPSVPRSTRPNPRAVLRPVVLAGLLVATVVAWGFRKPISARWMQRATLANEAPQASVLEEMIADDPSPAAAIVAAWNTDRIVHREVAIQQITRRIPRDQPLPPALERILLSGALDPDQNVREAAFSGLRARAHPALPALAIHQLADPDPEIRRLGLEQLRHRAESSAVPAILPLLDDPQLDIAALALHTLGRLSGQSFGIRLADAVPVDNPETGLREFPPESLEKVQAAASVAKAWFRQNPTSTPAHPPALPDTATTARRRIPAGDFELTTLDGSRFRLSQARGKVVLINFWTTWCTACIGEIPALIELRKRHGPELVLLGISLDALEDSHGHVGGHEASAGNPAHADEDPEEHAGHAHGPDAVPTGGHAAAPSLDQIRRTVETTVKRRDINYPVLIDARNDVGGRFNGGELPTTVIIDREGFVRRRFVGARSVAVFESMIREAMTPDSRNSTASR